jgi:hypothetical protein
MHMWHHVTNHLIISNDKDLYSENRIKLCVRDTNAMYTSKMGGRPFNEWYQDWSTYASRSGANEDTQMFAFRKALPMALHQKIMGVSPQPTTLEGLAEKA